MNTLRGRALHLHVIMSKEGEIHGDFVRKFLSQIFDEWITGVDSSEAPTVDAQTCRALRMAVGSDVFDRIIHSLVAEHLIEVVCYFEKAEPDETAIVVLDYCMN